MQILPLNQNCLGGGGFSAPVLEQFRVPSVLISLSLSVSVKHLCSRCAATLLHLALGGCEQMRAGGPQSAPPAPVLLLHPHIHAEWHRPRDELEGSVAGLCTA